MHNKFFLKLFAKEKGSRGNKNQRLEQNDIGQAA